MDNDFADCPNAGFNSIQAAVAAASAGDTILVCPGNYYGRVLISGHAKDGISVIANGRQDEVVLQRDPAQPPSTQRNGFQLQGVDRVLIRGFTVRDFGDIRSVPPGVSGVGNNILLLNAHNNTIQH
ncbi:MAG: hypothetical protein LC747_03040, partial [Acidobacteria bacterium]|nr:hypothetical protein [Acidobacteriota bacterium]